MEGAPTLRPMRILSIALLICSAAFFPCCTGSVSSNPPPPAVKTPFHDPPPHAPVPDCQLRDGDTQAELQQKVSTGCTRITTAAAATVRLDAATPLALPQVITLVFGLHARWDLSARTSVTVLGHYEIPDVREVVFTGSGHIVTAPNYDGITCGRPLRNAYPEWFGAVADDGLDDSDAILRALSFGDSVILAAGTYDTHNRIMLVRNQTLSGQGVSVTKLSQLPDARLVHYSTDPSNPDSQEWSDIMLQDFIVGLNSDCAAVKNLSILGNRLPDDLGQLSNLQSVFGADPLVSGIQISSHTGWTLGAPPIKNILVENVEVYLPASNCINIQSDRAATDVLIDGLVCNVRNRFNTSGLTIEAFHPTYANKFQNITVRHASFTGGTSVLYIAGVTNFVLEDSNVTGGAGTLLGALFYTSDNGHLITATVRRTSFALMNPQPNALAVIELAARGYVKDREMVFPFLVELPSSITFEGGTIQSAAYPAGTLVPLVWDNIGFHARADFDSVTFHGGSNAVLAGDPLVPAAFGSTVYVQNPDGGATTVRDVTPGEIDTYRMYHSNFYFSKAHFEDQAGSAIKVEHGSCQAYDSVFTDIGLDPASLDLPIIELGTPSPYNPQMSGFDFDSYSGVNATVFLRMPSSLSIAWGANNVAFATANSRPANLMDSIRLRP